jgi:PP-loop superfamily ATP-utilizing enzyme
VRVRHFGNEARIEVPLCDLSRLTAAERWERIVKGLRAAGYLEVVADPRGFESGRLNQPTEKIVK